MGAWYCTREELKSSLDIKETARSNSQVDSAIEGASRDIEGQLKRFFYPLVATMKFDWPNYTRSYPWRIWLDQHELISVTSLTSGGTVITAGQYNLEPVNDGPPYTSIELRRDLTGGFTAGSTPQQSIVLSGTFGYTALTVPAGALAVAMNDATTGSCTVTNGAIIGVGDIITADTERMIVTDRSFVTSTQVLQGTGCQTASAADATLAVTDGTKFFAGETLLIDAERLLVLDISGNNLTVKRAWDGSALATHVTPVIYWSHVLTVTRGALGTTAATHLISAALVKHVVPGSVRELCIAEAENNLLQKLSGYARTTGGGDNMAPASGSPSGLGDIRRRVYSAYARQGRARVV